MPGHHQSIPDPARLAPAVVALQLCVTQTFPASLVLPGVCPRPNPLTVSGAVSSARQRPEERRVASRRLGGGMLGCALSSGVTSHGGCRYSGHGGACSSTDLPPAAVLTRPARHQSPLTRPPSPPPPPPPPPTFTRQ